MSELKSFFEPPSIGEIRSKRVIELNSDDDLVNRILDLDPSVEALELNFDVLIGNYGLKQGDYWDYNHPSTIERARRARRFPDKLREIAFRNLKKNSRRTKTVLGLSARPLRSVDKRVRLFPLYSSFEGAKQFSYAIREARESKNRAVAKSRGIIVEDKYAYAPQAAEFGSIVRFEVPSRTKQRTPLTFVMNGLPLIDNLEKRVIVWGINFGTVLDNNGEPLRGETTIQQYDEATYRKVMRRNTQNQVLFQPHHAAAYFAYAQKQAVRGNNVPKEMNPFFWPNKLGAEFYNKITDSIIINSNGKRRHLRREEKSNLLVEAAVEGNKIFT